ncbi:MAG: hypothetical protein QXE80_07745 [Pyrobaculum sp.]
MFKIDDGIAPRELKIDLIKNGLRRVRKNYLECLQKSSSEICHTVAVNELLDMFGSLLPNVIYDVEFRYFLIKGVEELLLYDVDLDILKVVTLGELINKCIGRLI